MKRAERLEHLALAAEQAEREVDRALKDIARLRVDLASDRLRHLMLDLTAARKLAVELVEEAAA